MSSRSRHTRQPAPVLVDDAPPTAASERPGAVALPPVGRATTVAGLLAFVGAVAPLVGWGAAWPALAAGLSGWPVVPPGAALALAACGIGLVGQRPDVSPMARRLLAGVNGLTAMALAIGLRWMSLRQARVPDAGWLVEHWSATPLAAITYWPSRASAVALALLGIALVLLAFERTSTQRASWAAAAAAVLVTLTATGTPAAQLMAGAAPSALETAADQARAAVITPWLGWFLLLAATGVLLRRSDTGPVWIPMRGHSTGVSRRLLPAVLLLPPALVWTVDLLERRRSVSVDSAHAALTLLLVLGFGAMASTAVMYLVRVTDRGREREQRRLRRAREREVEHATAAAAASLQNAADRYRTHLRSILEVAPSPFLALDRRGAVSYANAAALALLGRPADDVSGRTLPELWPDAGDEIIHALETGMRGAAVTRTVAARDGRRLEVRGFPSDEGTALFVTAL